MKFTDSHEWIEWDGEDKEAVKVGITTYAQQELGEIVYVELPKMGKEIEAQQEIAVLESTKAAADIYSPVSGTIVGINQKLAASPELINQSPEEQGWLCKIKLSKLEEVELLMDASHYQAKIRVK